MGLRELLDAVSPEGAPEVVDEEAGESYAALAVMTLMLLLALALAVGQFLEKNHIDWMSEAGGALIMGIVVGLIVTMSNIDKSYSQVFEFNTSFFFIALLPPIIFDAGFNLDVKPFFRNIGAICTLAFLGTAISTIVISLMMFVVGLAGISFPISFLDACIFGAVISATDPVTVLAVFGRLRAHEDLNALVFGESVMNDAVAIVLYNVISSFSGKQVTAGGLAYGLWQFFYIFAGSLVAGLAFGFVAALLFKSKYFRNEHNPIEASLVVILAYCSFYVTDGLGLSGIVSIMFCGIVMAKYVRPNLSPSTDDRVGAFFRLIASLSEIFVFIYIGCATFTQQQAWGSGLTWSFIVFSLIALAISRAANVYPCIAFINAMRPPEAAVPTNHKHMLWFSGLRGAMAFALASLAREKLGETGNVVLTATLFLILITVLLNGGASAYLLDYMHLKQGNGDAESSPPPFTILEDDEYALSEPNGSAVVQMGVMTSDHNLQPSLQPSNSAGSGLRSSLMRSIHDFHRQGGVVQKFQGVDRVLESYLVAPTETIRTNNDNVGSPGRETLVEDAIQREIQTYEGHASEDDLGGQGTGRSGDHRWASGGESRRTPNGSVRAAELSEQ